MEHKEKVKQMFDGEGLCPYCNMGVSKISTSERDTAVCGWCNLKWIRWDGRVTEEDEAKTRITFLPAE